MSHFNFNFNIFNVHQCFKVRSRCGSEGHIALEVKLSKRIDRVPCHLNQKQRNCDVIELSIMGINLKTA